MDDKPTAKKQKLTPAFLKEIVGKMKRDVAHRRSHAQVEASAVAWVRKELASIGVDLPDNITLADLVGMAGLADDLCFDLNTRDGVDDLTARIKGWALRTRVTHPQPKRAPAARETAPVDDPGSPTKARRNEGSERWDKGRVEDELKRHWESSIEKAFRRRAWSIIHSGPTGDDRAMFDPTALARKIATLATDKQLAVIKTQILKTHIYREIIKPVMNMEEPVNYTLPPREINASLRDDLEEAKIEAEKRAKARGRR